MSDETGRGGDMTFPVQEKTYLEVWESELSRFVSAYYGQPWSMQQGEMLGQNTYRELDVDPQGPEFNSALAAEQHLREWLALEPPPGQSRDDWAWKMDMERDHYISVDTIMWDLCRKGVIPAGKYLIKVWW